MEPQEPHQPFQGEGGPPSGPMSLEFLKELAIFVIGLLLGVFWYVFFYLGSHDVQSHVIIALVILIFMLTRYIYWIKRKLPIVLSVVARESAIFIFGLFLGFFWSYFVRQAPDSMIHIIIGLVVIIIVMLRYLYLIKHPLP